MREQFHNQKRRKTDNRPDLLTKLMLAVIYCGFGAISLIALIALIIYLKG
jgi:hypothetical protein